jgi:dienelactone hydrolase
MPASSTQLDGYLYEPETTGTHPHPAMVFLHGCAGLLSSKTHMPESRQTAWAKVFNDRGYTVLMVDSFTPRGVKSVCSPKTWRDDVYAARPYDAYAGLAYLQSRPDIDSKHIGVMGWSNGGGVVLFTVGTNAPHKPPGFAAAIAFYPGSCSTKRLGDDWSSTIPLLVLVGAKDVWTPALPCQDALSRSTHTQLKIYPDSYHDFDWPGMAVHTVPSFTTSSGVVPIEGENPAAHADALKIVPQFLQRYLGQ